MPKGVYPRAEPIERFWKYVDKSGGCWLWEGARVRNALDQLYGTFMVGGRAVRAHRFLYAYLHGDIGEGLELDHLCRNTLCVNPDHLEPVTHKVNCNRGLRGVLRPPRTHCQKGHPWTSENIIRNSADNGLRCRICANESARRRDKSANSAA